MLPERLKQIPADQPIGKVSADGAYDTRGACAAIAGRGACAVIAGRGACAVIPARKNARPWLENTPGAQASNETVRSYAGVCQTSCPAISCGVSDFRGAGFTFGVEPDGSGGLPVAGFA